MSKFWVYCNPRRGRLLIHRSECPACEGNKPFLLEGVAAHPAQKGAWEAADTYKAALSIAEAMASLAPGLALKPCVICEPAEDRPRPAEPRQALSA